MLFFQVVLLFGYGYSYAVTRHLSRRAQGWLHAALLLVAEIVAFWLINHDFLSVQNISNTLAFTVELGLIALTMTLVVTATLLVRSFIGLVRANPGFNTSDLLTFEVTLPISKYRSYEDVTKMYTLLLDRLSHVSGVDAIGLGKALPLAASEHESTVYYVNDLPTDKNNYPIAEYTIASPAYFKSMGIALLAGLALFDWLAAAQVKDFCDELTLVDMHT